MNKSKITVTFFCLAAVLATFATSVSASSLKTTSQKAAEATPPPPSEVTVGVEKRQLFDTVELSCTTGFEAEVPISGPDKVPGVLTAAPLEEGDQVGDGTLLSEFNGSPVFALIGEFPLYRELKLGDSGPDVRLINDALVRAGWLRQQTEPAQSTVTEFTVKAIAAMYLNAGYAAPPDEEAIATPSAFRVLPAGGTVFGSVHETGNLGSEPIATIGIGPNGYVCTSGNGTVPAEAKEGQLIRIPSVSGELRPAKIIARSLRAPLSDNPSPNGTPSSGQPAKSGGSATDEDNRALFVELGATPSTQSSAVTAQLILAESVADAFVVPSAALWTRDNQTQLTVVRGSSSTEIPVIVDFTAAGENAVHPIKAGDLAVGQRITVVGTR